MRQFTVHVPIYLEHFFLAVKKMSTIGLNYTLSPDNSILNIGFRTDAVAFGTAHFGAGIGTIYLDDVACSGTEGRLIGCSRASSVRCSSGHSEDAGVRCQIRGWLL